MKILEFLTLAIWWVNLCARGLASETHEEKNMNEIA